MKQNLALFPDPQTPSYYQLHRDEHCATDNIWERSGNEAIVTIYSYVNGTPIPVPHTHVRQTV